MTTSLDFASFAPTLPVVPPAQVAEFLETAPAGTVVEVDGNLYQRAAFSGRWLGLNDVVLDYTFGNPAAIYEDWTPGTVVDIAVSQEAEVFVVRIGGSRA